MKIGLGIGDAPSETKQIDDCDILVCTSEKLDSLMRSKSEVLRRVSVVVADEFHLLNDSHRGPTMEINLARIRHLLPDAQIITLSATVGNSQDLADWLESDLIVSQWRPVSLEYATLAELELEPRAIQKSEFSTSSDLGVPRTLDGPKSHIAWAALQDVYQIKGQLLVFVASRRSAQSEAKKLAKRMQKYLEKNNPEALPALKELCTFGKVIKFGDGRYTCRVCKRGVAFHHAGLMHTQRAEMKSIQRANSMLSYCYSNLSSRCESPSEKGSCQRFKAL